MKMIRSLAAPLLVVSLSSIASAQTLAPTPAPDHPCVANLPDETPTCWDSMDDLWCNEWVVEQDYSTTRTYYLCPGTYTIGQASTDDARDPWFGGERSLLLTPNIEIICGNDGVPSNDCVVSGGLFHMQGYTGGGIGENLIQGITFQSALLFNVGVLGAATQSITFKECNFIDNLNNFLFYVAGDPNNAIALNYTFEDVVFDNNANFEGGQFPGMITLNHAPSTLVMKRVKITNNLFNQDSFDFGYAINTVGPLILDEVCFEGNAFKQWAPVISLSNTTTTNNVSGPVDEDLFCPMTVDFDVGCFGGYDADFCFDGTAMPSVAPSIEATDPAPMATPTKSPDAPPTDSGGGKSSPSQPLLVSVAFFLLVNAWIMM